MTDEEFRQVIAAASMCDVERVAFPYPRDIDSPLSVLLATFGEKINVRMDFALVFGRDPEFFLLETEDRFIVVVDAEYLGAVYGIICRFFSPVPFMSPDLLYKTKLGLCVQLVQEYIPVEDFSDEIKARIRENLGDFAKRGSVINMTFPSAAPEIEMLPYDEFYLALWFFFAAHEIGHCIQKTGNWERVIKGDLEDLVVASESHARNHVKRIQESWITDDLEALFTVDDSASLIGEIFCDQTAFVMVTEMMNVMKDKGYGEFSVASYFAESIFLMFAAHQTLLELRRLRHRLGLFGQKGLEGYQVDRKRNSIRFAYLRDLVACLIPCSDDVRHFKATRGFGIFGYYGATGIRETASNIQSVKTIEVDRLIDEALGIVFDGCFS